jgi:lambda family phage tail tape measure protein
VAEYVIRVVIDASGAKPVIANTVASVGNVEKAAEKSSRSIRKVKTDAEIAASALAKMGLAATNGLSVKGSLADVLRAGRVQAELFNTDLQKMQTAAKAGLNVTDKGLETQLKKSKAEAEKLANELYRVSKAARDSLAATRGGGLDKMLRSSAGDVDAFLKAKKAGGGPSKADRDWATQIFENSAGAQNKLMARNNPLGANLLKTKEQADALADSMRKAGKASDDLGSSLGRIAAIAAAGAIATLVSGVIALSDEYTVLQNKLRTVTDGQAELDAKTEETFALAQRLRSEWSATAQVYGRISRSTKELGLSEAQVMTITENLTKAIKVSGATANETKSVLLQLGQAFGSGKLNGDEFRSVMENATEVGNVLADSLGVTRGQLKGLSSAGRITSEVLARAFLQPHRVFEEFSSSVPTFAERFTMLRNAATKSVGEWAKSSALMAALGKTIEFAAEHVEVLIRAAAALGVLLTGALVAYAIPKAIVAFHALTAAMMANPWIAAATAISVLAVALSGLGGELEKIDRKQLGEIIANKDQDGNAMFAYAARTEEISEVVKEATANAKQLEKAMQAVFDEIRHGNTIIGQMEEKVRAASSAIDVVKSIQKMSLSTVPALIDAVTTSTLKNVDRLVKQAEEAKRAFEALKRETEQLVSASDPMTAKVLEWNKAEETLGRALKAKLITLEEQNKVLDATYDRIFDAPRTTEALPVFANSSELAKTAVARDELLTQMGEEQRAVERSNKLYLDMTGVHRDYVEAIKAANQAFAEGRVTYQDYLELLEETELALLRAERGAKSLEYGIASGWDAMLDQATDVAGAVESAFVNAYAGVENALVDLVVTGQTNFKDLIDSMLGDVTRILARLAFASLLAGDYGKAAIAGGAVGAGGLFSALGGFAQGGSYTVGGTGGPDSKIAAFRVTPGETVTVQTPNQRAKGNFGNDRGPQVVNRIYNVYDPREVSAIDTPAGGRAINNVIRRNPQIVRSRQR